MSVTPVHIELDDASFGWHGHPALKSVSGRFAAGGMTAVVGPNGAGKSTLIKGIMGVLRPMTGSVRISGAGRSELAWLPQAAELDRSFPVPNLTVAWMRWRRWGWRMPPDAAWIRSRAVRCSARCLRGC
ncbi:hypothetical protein G6F31_018029 [Rhizopus arrhizus]|nr:hypothetical protein G6F31_018029 [Rhizopus arrhizus]